ncbi:hypothetical protein M404DRAFT_403169 [Pisolithus tinctorius Marx 270]|uniref:Uncharacterized protein n=1 Tax=Pisolithus tinctorius Marx 270 TaxID=870435 RepID=A0A0C3IAY4_PISTI|nr:hypothetical protein M404DRAFT_403169 [Pisolithus tinctorius Marx 270]
MEIMIFSKLHRIAGLITPSELQVPVPVPTVYKSLRFVRPSSRRQDAHERCGAVCHEYPHNHSDARNCLLVESEPGMRDSEKFSAPGWRPPLIHAHLLYVAPRCCIMRQSFGLS